MSIRLQINKTTFLQKLKVISTKLLNDKSSQAVMRSVLVRSEDSGGISLFGTNISTSLTLYEEALVEKKFSFLVNAKRLANILEGLEHEEIDLAVNATKIDFNDGESSLTRLDEKSYPNVPDLKADPTPLTADAISLHVLLKNSSYAVVGDPAEILSGTSLTVDDDGATALSTDKMIISKVQTNQIKSATERKFLISRPTVLALLDLLPSEMTVEVHDLASFVVIKGKGFSLAAQKFAKPYPAVERIIGKAVKEPVITLAKQKLEQIAKKASVFGGEKHKISLIWDGTELQAVSKSLDGESTAKVESKDLTIKGIGKFNILVSAEYILTATKHLGQDCLVSLDQLLRLESEQDKFRIEAHIALFTQ